MNAERPFAHRRAWLHGLLAAGLLGRMGNARHRADIIELIKAKGRSAGMQPFDSSETEHFVGIGDALPRYRIDALRLCELFAGDYFAHFRGKGFNLAWPESKLPVVILGGPTSYTAFEKGFPDEAIGGHFDLDANWLVTFDFRALADVPRGPGAADPRLDNTLALVHETFHQLSYNTDMLDREVDVPLCLAEGLATYAETWGPNGRGRIGDINTRRRRGLEMAHRSGERWISVKQLLADDKLLENKKTQQVAYAVSSLLVHKLMKVPARLTQLRAYLKEVQVTNEPSRRINLATSHFGDLDKLDREIRPGRLRHDG